MRKIFWLVTIYNNFCGIVLIARTISTSLSKNAGLTVLITTIQYRICANCLLARVNYTNSSNKDRRKVLFKWANLSLFFLYFFFSKANNKQMVCIKCYQRLDSNHCPLVLEATALSTQPLPCSSKVFTNLSIQIESYVTLIIVLQHWAHFHTIQISFTS